ncbi:MAG: hypothetical protein SGI92_17460 [Bryobacteraceae bacterium]|nr:hypothetical protein [Bryobacteraceae bacterium]
MGLGSKFGVDPFIFGGICVGAIPFFSLSIAWLAGIYAESGPRIAPLLASGFFSSPLTYIFEP